MGLEGKRSDSVEVRLSISSYWGANNILRILLSSYLDS